LHKAVVAAVAVAVVAVVAVAEVVVAVAPAALAERHLIRRRPCRPNSPGFRRNSAPAMMNGPLCRLRSQRCSPHRMPRDKAAAAEWAAAEVGAAALRANPRAA
jgi:hypothetical protein